MLRDPELAALQPFLTGDLCQVLPHSPSSTEQRQGADARFLQLASVVVIMFGVTGFMCSSFLNSLLIHWEVHLQGLFARTLSVMALLDFRTLGACFRQPVNAEGGHSDPSRSVLLILPGATSPGSYRRRLPWKRNPDPDTKAFLEPQKRGSVELLCPGAGATRSCRPS